jgi:hypothetical protein
MEKEPPFVNPRSGDSSSSQQYTNSNIVFKNVCLDKGTEYYDYENFDIPWESVAKS